MNVIMLKRCALTLALISGVPEAALCELQVDESSSHPAASERALTAGPRRASHVRFSTPAPPTIVHKTSPVRTAGMNSSNAGALLRTS
jgi:hypothetical protein